MNDQIIIGFSRAKGFKLLSRFIMLFEKTPFSHVYIKTYNSYFKQYDIFQASKGYVNHIIENNFLTQNTVINEFIIPIHNDNKKEILLFLRDKLGKPYSFKDLIIIFLSKFGIKLNKYLDGEDAYICSELVARAMKYSNIIYIDKNSDLITPKDLYEILNNKI